MNELKSDDILELRPITTKKKIHRKRKGISKLTKKIFSNSKEKASPFGNDEKENMPTQLPPRLVNESDLLEDRKERRISLLTQEQTSIQNSKTKTKSKSKKKKKHTSKKIPQTAPSLMVTTENMVNSSDSQPEEQKDSDEILKIRQELQQLRNKLTTTNYSPCASPIKAQKTIQKKRRTKKKRVVEGDVTSPLRVTSTRKALETR